MRHARVTIVTSSPRRENLNSTNLIPWCDKNPVAGNNKEKCKKVPQVISYSLAVSGTSYNGASCGGLLNDII